MRVPLPELPGSRSLTARQLRRRLCPTKPAPDYAGSRLLVFLGVNPVVSHGHTTAMPSPTTAIRELRAHAEVWVIDPRATETARLASGHIAPRPGTDYAILAYVVRELLRSFRRPPAPSRRPEPG
jgi:anaerobic selenocysteine-containing dehydrogenase